MTYTELGFIIDWREVFYNNDGCSSGPLKYLAKLFLNRNYACLCRDHDMWYRYGWKYGVSRLEADTELRDGIVASGHKKTAWVVFAGVRSFGWLFYKKGYR